MNRSVPMATVNQMKTGSWKAVIRKAGWPTKSKTFRVERDATDWARRTEDEMVRGVFIDRASSHRQKLTTVLDRYLSEVTPTKKPSTAVRENRRVKILKEHLGDFSLTALTPEIIGQYREKRIREGMSASSVRLELALLSHLFTIAIREWRLGLVGTQCRWFVNPSRRLDATAACIRAKRNVSSMPAMRTRIRCWVGLCAWQYTPVCVRGRSKRSPTIRSTSNGALSFWPNRNRDMPGRRMRLLALCH